MASNTRRTAIAVIFLVVVLTLCVVLLAVVLTTESKSKSKSKGKDESGESTSTVSPSSMPTHKARFTFENMFHSYINYFRMQWISDSKYVQIVGGNITVTDLTDNSIKVLVPQSVMKNQSANYAYYSLSPDEQWVLLTCNYKKLYRHSYTADYVAYNVNTGEIVKITPPDKTKQVQYAMWGNKGNSLAFAQNNDIYYMSNVTSQQRRITFNGEEHKIFNGITDWLYEEDVYYSKQAMWFSTDDFYLGFIEFNDTQVDWFSYIRYGPYKDAYPEVMRIAYPKPGHANPKVKVKVIDLRNQNSTPKVLDPPSEFVDIDHYFTNMAWKDNNILLVAWSNRVQNISVFMQYNLTSGKSYENQRQKVKNGWVELGTYLKPNPWYSKDGSYYLILRPFEQGSAGKFIHVAKISMGENGTIKNLTSGQWEVRYILAFNKNKEIVYFASTETSAREMNIYSLDLKNMSKTCLSCATPWAKSGRCKYFSASFSKSTKWYTLQCSGPGVPLTSLHNTETNKGVIVVSNQQVIEIMKKMMIPQRRSFTFESGGYTIDGLEILPPDFNPDKKYGVLLDVYGGPGSQRVFETFSISNSGWNAYLVSNYDIIIVRIDGRGQRGRGERFKHEVYLKLGEYEAEDTINAGRYMQKKPYVDKDKLAIWGWSYGGYLTTYVLSKNTGVFKVGLAVAPVTDWRYYDTAYTERYMGLLKDNLQGYDFTSLLKRASQFRNVSYLIVHGSGDDNVHYQHTAQMVKALTLAKIDFRVQYYTDKAHSISGSTTRRHLYHLLSEYLTTKLGLEKRT